MSVSGRQAGEDAGCAGQGRGVGSGAYQRRLGSWHLSDSTVSSRHGSSQLRTGHMEAAS